MQGSSGVVIRTSIALRVHSDVDVTVLNGMVLDCLVFQTRRTEAAKYIPLFILCWRFENGHFYLRRQEGRSLMYLSPPESPLSSWAGLV